MYIFEVDRIFEVLLPIEIVYGYFSVDNPTEAEQTTLLNSEKLRSYHPAYLTEFNWMGRRGSITAHLYG